MFAAVSFAQDKAAPDVLGEWEITTLSPIGESTNTVEFRIYACGSSQSGTSIRSWPVSKCPVSGRPVLYDV